MEDSLPTRLQLEIVTPNRQVVRDSVLAVSVPGKDGYLGILPGHAPLLSLLQPGEVSYTRNAVSHYLAVSWGFVEVLPDRVIVLAETGERAEEIDVSRAERARQKAEERLGKLNDPTIDRERAQRALERAMARLSAAAKLKLEIRNPLAADPG
jgi:F-type H+-transporting ATPase subunit epsilon